MFLRALAFYVSLRQERSQRLAKSIEKNQKNQGRGGGVIPLGRAQAEQENPQLLVEERVRVRLRMLFWCLAIALGALQVWAHRNEMNPDGISYIEMAEAAARGAWHALANAYWSPLYPLLLSVSFRLFHPRMYWEFTSVHVVNFGLYLVDLFCFEFFLKELLAARRAESIPEKELRPLAQNTLWSCGCLLFLWSSQFWLSPAMVNPDIIVAGLVYVATALLLRIYRGKKSWLLFASLGLVLGVGYLARTAMFPVSFVFLASGFMLCGMSHGSYSNPLAKSALAMGVFLAISAPLVMGLSKEKGRATFGDSGRIAYAEYVNHAPLTTHWQGEPAGTGIPAHPTRRVFADPAIYEFAQPVAGSYPPWYDPSYWYEGIRPHFSLPGQLWVLFRSANLYLKLLSRSGALYVVFMALILLGRKEGKWDWGGRRIWLAWLPSVAALAMYSLVLVEQRYVSPFALMLLQWICSSARISVSKGEALTRRTVLAAILALSLAVAWPAVRDLREMLINRPYEHWQVAVGLHQIGISPGMHVGTIGSGLPAYWAHLAGLKIIAEIPEKEQASFLAANSVSKQEVLRKFSELGAKAVVTKNDAARSLEGWQQIKQTHYYVWLAPGKSK
ncbi:MAG: hypothetical protein DMG38_12695 [Acidobacteria bacterium]|nr:MAG: hypothetical protein DMG38_12695 [Acidobacteriota bacterium]